MESSWKSGTYERSPRRPTEACPIPSRQNALKAQVIE